jgi:hypothetical protein
MLPGLLVWGTRRWDGSGSVGGEGVGCAEVVGCFAEVAGCLLGVQSSPSQEEEEEEEERRDTQARRRRWC